MSWLRCFVSLFVIGGLISGPEPLRPPAVQDFSFIHCSDTHVPPGVTRRTGPPGGPQFGTAEVVAQLKALEGPLLLAPYGVAAPPPAFAIATGDLTEFGGLNGWWEQYLKLWEGARFPVYHASGNHDSTWACQRFNIRKLHGGPFYSFDHGGCHFIGWDSATPQDPRPSFGQEELNWLREDLKKLAPETPVFLFCHHPIDSSEFASLYERDRLLDLLRPYNLALLLVGHGHSVQRRVVAGVDQVMGGSTFGTAPGYAVISIQGGMLRVAYRPAAEPAATRAMLEKPLPGRATYPRITVASPPERGAVGRGPLTLQALIDRQDVTRAEWQADDAPGRGGSLFTRSPGQWEGLVSVRDWEPGAHYLRFVFHTPGGEFQRTVTFYTGGGEARPRWRAFLGGSSKSTPAVEGDSVYVGASDGGLYALDRNTGERRWCFMTGGEVLAGPLVREGVIYFGSGDGHFYAVDRRGRECWRFTAEGPVYSSAVWADGMVLFGANDARFYALDARTGRPRWISDVPDYTIESRPWVEGDTVYFGAWDTFVYALNLADGSVRWKTPGAGSAASAPGVARYYSPADAGPVVAGGKVYIADRAYVLTVLDAGTGEVLGTRRGVSAVGVSQDRRAVYLRATDGNLQKVSVESQDLWSRPAFTSFIPSAPRESRGVVYTAGPTGRIAALDAIDGRLLWQYQATPRLYVFSDVAAADGTAYVSGMDGSVTALVAR